MTEVVKNQPDNLMPKQKKAYQTPELVNYGAVADLTSSANTMAGSDNLVMPNRS